MLLVLSHDKFIYFLVIFSLLLGVFLPKLGENGEFERFGLVKSVQAATLSISSIAVGKVISVGGQQFVKIGTDPMKGSQFIALQVAPVCKANEFNGINMQDFTGGDCDCLPTPAANSYILAGVMKDTRDGKSYEIRKFADGRCWMVDNLMYGGPSDNCAGVDTTGYADATYGGADGMASPSNRFGAGTYGNCRDPRVDGVSPCTAGSTACGYLYNWQAAMQLSSAYYSAAVAYPNGTPTTTNFYQGICPPGWHLPSGGSTASISEFSTLDIANGGTGDYQGFCADASCDFWRPDYNYESVYAGFASSSGSLSDRDLLLYLWSASEYSTTNAGSLYVNDENVDPGTDTLGKYYGFAVRCVKD